MLLFNKISDLYTASSVKRLPNDEAFDILLFNELGAEVKKMMPPHRRGFLTIIFMKDQKSGQISSNQNKHVALSNALLFQGTEHIFSFVRDENVEGVVLLFNKSFLLPFIENLDIKFPFFSVLNQNLFHLNSKERQFFEQLFSLIYDQSAKASIVKPLLVALLEKSLQLYLTYSSEEQFLTKKMLTVRKYKNLINNSFLEKKEVRYYADQLNVSANYLNEIIKSETGISAKRHITERLLLEAKNLLLYSEMDIAEISHILQFSEPTHFTKFFKKETGLTPKNYQNQQP